MVVCIHKVQLSDFESILEIKFQIKLDDSQHHSAFFKDYIQGSQFMYQGFVNKILTMLFPGLEENIE